MRSERSTETIDITKMEIGRLSDVIDVGGKGECAVEDENGRVINGKRNVMEFV